LSPTDPRSQRLSALSLWWLHHRLALATTLERLAADRAGTALVALTLGITLALPTLLWASVSQLAELADDWHRAPRINVFVDPAADAERVLEALRDNIEIAGVAWQSPAESLDEFARASGHDDALAAGMDALGGNPLPGVALVTPASAVQAPARMRALADRLEQLEGVDGVQLDLDWVLRLQATLVAAGRLVWGLAALLALGALLVVGSLVRMALEQRREEILVLRLVGGTDAFVRRPFLYTGALQGALGGLAAWLLVLVCLSMLAGPVGELARSYGSGFRLRIPWLETWLVLVLGGGLLGWAGARFAAGRSLRAMEP
jgi:cell division transport system permease protein